MHKIVNNASYGKQGIELCMNHKYINHKIITNI